jgi:hypothetical protein
MIERSGISRPLAVLPANAASTMIALIPLNPIITDRWSELGGCAIRPG